MESKRVRMPNERISVVEKIEMYPEGDGHDSIEGYIILGFYDDGRLGELFVNVGKEGELIRGLVDGFATMFSIALQHGAPLETLLSKLKFTQFSPRGATNRKERRYASSILDLIAHVVEDVVSRGASETVKGYFGHERGTGKSDSGVDRMQKDQGARDVPDGDVSQ